MTVVTGSAEKAGVGGYNKTALVSSFAAIPDLKPSSRGSGLVLEWQQKRGTLLATGNSTLLRVWDLETERVSECPSSRIRPRGRKCALSLSRVPVVTDPSPRE